MYFCMQIVELLNIVYCLAELTEFAAFIHLRRKAPHLRRPFRIGLNTWGCALMLTPATALLIALIAQPLLDVDWMVSLHPFACFLHVMRGRHDAKMHQESAFGCLS